MKSWIIYIILLVLDDVILIRFRFYKLIELSNVITGKQCDKRVKQCDKPYVSHVLMHSGGKKEDVIN